MHHGFTRLCASAAIPACWLLSMAWLVRTEILPQRLPPSAAPSAVSSGAAAARRDAWWGVYYHETKIGYVYQSWTPRALGAGTSITAVTELELPVQGTVRTVHINLGALLDPQHRVDGLSAMIVSGPQVLALSGSRRQGRLEVRLETGGRAAGTLTLPEDVQLPELLTAPWVMTEARPGQRWSREVFDPLTQQQQAALVEVLREEPPTAHDRRWLCPPAGDCGAGAVAPLLVVRTTLAGLTTTSWVTREGAVLREETPLGFVMRREAPAEARLIHRKVTTAAADLSARLAVPTDLRLADPRATRTLTVRLLGVEAPSDWQLSTPRQRWTPARQGGLVTITQESAEAIRSVPWPLRESAYTAWLRPSLLVQSEDPAIQAQARAIVGDAADAWEAAVRLHAWVARTLTKTPSVGVPSATDVLRTKQGDCNEHTVLFTALARSIGLPTQMCAGVVYYRDAFYYHAWPRVFVGQWVEMDPTLGQTIADATHLQLLEGDLAKQVQLLGVLGRLRIEAVKDGQR